ncbi:MAG TPA: APC family permease [Gemmatimonadales bacterium]
MTTKHPSPPNEQIPAGKAPRLSRRLWRVVVGAPRSLADTGLIHRLSLVPLLAWVGLGADGLSSSAYGPEEAFKTLGAHSYLAVLLALIMAATVIIISSAYSRLIEEFPSGGGGYVVATKLLGERAGVVSGCALLVDYVLTITVSIAAAGDALFSFVPLHYHVYKLPAEAGLIVLLTTLNLRGVRESVLSLTPVFLLFVVTHIVVIVGGVVARAPELPAMAHGMTTGFTNGWSALGPLGLFLLLVHAYSLGGGTYTGIEAVSNGLPIMREPRIRTARRTMLYMAASLAFTASGLLVLYLLWDVAPVEGKTLNAVLVERFAGAWRLGTTFVLVTLASEGALLVVAAQAGFTDGPRVLANMAVDSWVPHRFAGLSERLTTQNGILLMGVASLAALVYTRGNVGALVVMYSINVFLTFSLSMFGMARHTVRTRSTRVRWIGRALLFAVGFVLCATILGITVAEKFAEGGWITLGITGVVIGLCFLIRRHYRQVGKALEALYAQLGDIASLAGPELPEPDPAAPTAAVLVGSYNGLGMHTALNVFRSFPGHFKNLVFVVVGVVDSGGFKGEGAIEALRDEAAETGKRYLQLARGMGVPATVRTGVGVDAVEEIERVCLDLIAEFPKTTVFAGNVIFQEPRWYQRWLHNQTAFAVQQRLQWAGRTMVILPARVTA